MSIEEKLNVDENKGLLSRISDKIRKSITTKAIAYGLAAGLALGTVYALHGCGGDGNGDGDGNGGGSQVSPYAGHWYILLKYTDVSKYAYSSCYPDVDDNGNFGCGGEDQISGRISNDGQVSGNYKTDPNKMDCSGKEGTFSGSCNSINYCEGNVSDPCGGIFTMQRK